jgi:uncharacterized oligopeptide transporter (OPT) family protein
MGRHAVLWGAAVGVALTSLERLPPRIHRWLPSATGVGLGMVIPFQYPLSFFLGALIGWAWKRRRPEHAARFTVPVASGVIAGESLVGVVVAIANNFFLGGH